jgi:hypothetical protein
MKLSPILCASIVAFAALVVSANGVFAASYSTTKSNVKTSGVVTAPNAGPKPCFYLKGGKPSGTVEPCPAGQSTSVNSSRSNIRNN